MNWEDIRAEFELTDISLKDLAEKHGIKPATLRSRKNREKWEKNGSQQKNATQRKDATRNATQRKNVATQKAIEQLDENNELTEQQKQFCLEYSRFPNATKAYQKAYKCDWRTADANAYRLMGRDGILTEIKRIKEARRKDWLIDDADITREWMRQAFADVSDFVEFGTETKAYLDDDGNMHEEVKNYVRFKNADEVDGSLIQEVKMGRDGPVIKLYDKQKAMQELQKRLGDGGGESALKLQLIQAQIDKINNDLKVDTKTEDKLKGYFEMLGVEIDGS